ncbi:unnamed protein product [Vitrella brassicaformis CCMP3155]|uniref:Protein YIPF n=1 Tax=Vitrella brassicaformis (strain CCMP3155) TaxID=1169540 RepID=A0A0G4FSF5_VITBC|nr:unnamed protein product [Vitrella brassicaformis CCMP3155]|eukprot:CEM17589.1 unnamed protein product [Vitrella brassicaformis CCMP3155]
MDAPLSSERAVDCIGTLDEPVVDTIMRDLRSVGKKLYYVMLPRSRSEAGAGLKQWDLWGPLFLCLILSIILWANAPENQQEVVFGLVYVIVWLGAVVVTFNALLLGGKISFFQSVCVLGYCICPLVLAAFACLFLPSSIGSIVKFILMLIALHWATGASVGFMSELVAEDRKALAVYPVWLFYVAIAWLILLN